MFLANKQDRRFNAFSADRHGVSAAHPTMSISAETLSICAVRVPFASATSLRTIFEISSFSHPWRVTTGPRLFAT
jgi:hypothetical protein